MQPISVRRKALDTSATSRAVKRGIALPEQLVGSDRFASVFETGCLQRSHGPRRWRREWAEETVIGHNGEGRQFDSIQQRSSIRRRVGQSGEPLGADNPTKCGRGAVKIRMEPDFLTVQ